MPFNIRYLRLKLRTKIFFNTFNFFIAWKVEFLKILRNISSNTCNYSTLLSFRLVRGYHRYQHHGGPQRLVVHPRSTRSFKKLHPISTGHRTHFIIRQISTHLKRSGSYLKNDHAAKMLSEIYIFRAVLLSKSCSNLMPSDREDR